MPFSWIVFNICRNQPDINQAWDLYYHVFRRITKQLQQLQSLSLHYVSPLLEKCDDLELCMPGQYRPNEQLVRIKSFVKTLKVSVLSGCVLRLTLHKQFDSNIIVPADTTLFTSTLFLFLKQYETLFFFSFESTFVLCFI